MTRLSASCVVVVTKMRKGTIELFFQVELVFGFFFLQVTWVFLEMLI